jgi:hypothetical protein
MLIFIIIDSRPADKFKIFTSFEVAVKRVLAVFFIFFLTNSLIIFLSLRLDGQVEIDPNKIIKDAIIRSARLSSSSDGGLSLLNSSV